MMQEIISRYEGGAAIRGLASEFGLPYSTLHYRLTRICSPARKRGQREALSAKERFWNFVSAEPNSGCWLWLGHRITKYGYGSFYYGERQICAHRAAWLIYRGPIPAGLEIDHRCLTPACVNPDHLRLATKAVNLAQRRLTRTHCKRGHPLIEPNLMFEGAARRCKQCRDGWRASWLTASLESGQ